MKNFSQTFDPRQTMAGSEFEIFHYRDPIPTAIDVHHHDFYEIYFFLEGDVQYWVEGRTYKLSPGEMLLIHPMQLHRAIFSSERTYERIVLWIDKSYIESLTPDGGVLLSCFEGRQANILQLSPLQRTELISRMNALVRESRSKELGAALAAKGLFLQCMVDISRLYQATGNAVKLTDDLSQKVLAYIGEHFNEPITLESLSREFFVSKYHLSHEFSRATGISVYRFIRLKRLQAARAALLEGVSPSEVCSACGFGDYTSFFRAFKAEYGISPSELQTTY